MEDCWYMIIFLLYDLEIEKALEAFLKENQIIGIKGKVSDMTYEDLAISVVLFLEENEETILDKAKKTELLRFCK